MTDAIPKRRITALLMADVTGYSRLMGINEGKTIDRVRHLREELVEPAIKARSGRLVKSMGDGFLAEFASVVDATVCAVTLQKRIEGHNGLNSGEEPLLLRIGIHVGDVLVEGDDLFGTGVNVVARIESVAEPGSVFLSEDAHRQVEGKLPYRFEDAGERILKNIARPIRVFRFSENNEADSGHAVLLPVRKTTKGYPALPEKPSLAILPFDNLSGDLEQTSFADGITEDLITSVSQISNLLVVARNSTFAYKGKATDIRRVARELGVRYVLEGSIRKGGNRMRVNAQLIEAENGRHVWAERFDRDLSDIFAVQDDLVREIVIALRVNLTDGEQARVWLRSTSNVQAWLEAMQGVDRMWRSTAIDNARALEHFGKAIAIDSNYSFAIASTGQAHYFDARFGYSGDSKRAMDLARESAECSLRLNPAESYGHIVLALVLASEDDFDKAISEAMTAISFSPNDSFLHSALARVLVNADRPAEAEVAIRHAIRLNPFYPVNYLAVLSDALVHQGRDEEAEATLKELLQRNPAFISAHLHLIGIYMSRDDHESAHLAAREVLRINPSYKIADARWFNLTKDPIRKKQFLSGLRTAGIPD